MPTTIEAPRLYPPCATETPAKMIDWLGEAFGFTVRARYGEGDIVHHAELVFGSSMIMLGTVRDDDYGKMVGEPGQAAASRSISPSTMPTRPMPGQEGRRPIIQELTDRDYGSREFICRDPEGNVWSFGTYWPKAGEKALNRWRGGFGIGRKRSQLRHKGEA